MECSLKCSLEIERIFQNMPSTLDNIEEVIDCLIDPITENHMSLIQKKITPKINTIHQQMQSLNDELDVMKSDIDNMIEWDVVNLSKLQKKMNSIKTKITEKNMDFTRLIKEQSTATQTLKETKADLENASKRLLISIGKLNDAKTSQTIVQVVSVPLLAGAPFVFLVVGPILTAVTAIAGGTMAVSSLTILKKEVKDRESIADHAKQQKQKLESTVVNLNRKTKSLQTDLNNIDCQEKQLREEERALNKSISDKREVHKKISYFLSWFNEGFHKLTEVSGRSRVLKSHAEFLYNLSHLVPLLVEFYQSYFEFSDTKLFEILNIKALVKKSHILRIKFKLEQLQEEYQLSYFEDESSKENRLELEYDDNSSFGFKICSLSIPYMIMLAAFVLLIFIVLTNILKC